MHKNDLMTQTNDSSNRMAIQDLSAEMIELSDEALSQLYGGINVNLNQFLFGGMIKLGGRYVKPDEFDLTPQPFSSSDAVDPALEPPPLLPLP